MPTHLYSSKDWVRSDFDNFRGTIDIKASFDFPLHPVDEDGTKGFILIVDNHWPNYFSSFFDITIDKDNKIFKLCQNIRADDDSKLIVTFKAVDQSLLSFKLGPN